MVIEALLPKRNARLLAGDPLHLLDDVRQRRRGGNLPPVRPDVPECQNQMHMVRHDDILIYRYAGVVIRDRPDGCIHDPPQRCQGDSRRAIDNRPYGGFDGAQDLLIPLPGADGDEIRSRLAVIIGLQPQALPLGRSMASSPLSVDWECIFRCRNRGCFLSQRLRIY